MIPTGMYVLGKDAESPTVEKSMLADIYQKFNSNGWESLDLESCLLEDKSEGKAYTKGFEIGGRYLIVPRIGVYSSKELLEFTGEHSVLPTLKITKHRVPAIYPSDWELKMMN